MNHDPTAKEIAVRIGRKAVESNKLNALLNSSAGIKMANLEVNGLFSEIRNLLPALAEDETKLKPSVTITRKNCIARVGKYAVQLYWDTKYKNTLKEAGLQISLWKGPLAIEKPIYSKFIKAKLIEKRSFIFNLNPNGRREWYEQTAGGRPFTSRQLARLSLGMLVSAVPIKHKHRLVGIE